jgi:hypothetical protein
VIGNKEKGRETKKFSLLIRGSQVQVLKGELKGHRKVAFFVMFYIYIIYSAASDLYYVGHTDDYVRRLTEHNEAVHNRFTSKHRPWVLKAVSIERDKK